MEFYTLDSTFQRKSVVDSFYSAIWTERYSLPGDVSLVVSPTPAAIAQFKEGTFLSLKGTNEVMIIDTQSIENNKLTLTGSSLLQFLEERAIFGITASELATGVYKIQNKTAGEIMSNIVSLKVIFPVLSDPPQADRIPGLYLGAIDTSGPSISVAIPYGTVLDALKTVAETYSLGMKIYLDSAPSSGLYVLKFTVYKGVTRTVKFSPSLDSLTNIKELRSNKGYKTVAYAFTKNEPKFPYAAIAEDYPGANLETGFTRRLLTTFVDDVTLEKLGAVDPAAPTAGELQLLIDTMTQRAKDSLANNNYTKVVDGEIVPQSQYKFGVDYFMGDIVQLQGTSGLTQNARITEYIRSQDETGERAYPSVSVIS